MAMPAPEAAPTTPCTENKGFVYSWQHTAAHTDSQPPQMSDVQPEHQSCSKGQPTQRPVLQAYAPTM